MMNEQKLSNFKIGRSNIQNGENRGIKLQLSLIIILFPSNPLGLPRWLKYEN